MFDKVKGRLYTTSISEASVTGFGERGDYSRLDGNTSFLGEELTVTTAKKYLQGLPTGAYVRLRTPYKDKDGNYICHSFSVIDTSSTGITVYQANFYDKFPCMVTLDTYTWDKFIEANKDRRLLFIVD